MPISFGYPPVGGEAKVTLVSGSVYNASWDGLRWWIKVPGDKNELPVEKVFVESWRPLPQGKPSWLDRILSALRLR